MKDIMTSVLGTISNYPHALIKRIGNDYSNVSPNIDIDILALDTKTILNAMLRSSKKFIGKELSIRVRKIKGEDHFHFDVMSRDALWFRIDLYGSLANYSKIEVKPNLFESIIDRAEKQIITVDNIELELKVPCLIDEAIIRYLEYQEWYASRPDKIKHIDWIINNIDSEVKRNEMLARLHHFTKIRLRSLERPVVSRSPKANILKRIQSKIGRMIKRVSNHFRV